MSLTLAITRRIRTRRQTTCRPLRFETLQSREMMAGDVFIGPQPKPAERRNPIIQFNLGDAAIADDVKRASGIVGKSPPASAMDVISNSPTEVVHGGQDAARMGNAATEVVDGGQAARIGNLATEIVDGGQAAANIAAGPWDHLPRIIKSPEYHDVFNAHLNAVHAGDMGEAIRTANQLDGLEVLQYPDGSEFYKLTGEPYLPANQVDEVIEGIADSGSAGGRMAGKVLGVIGTAADFVVDPVLGAIFYDENLETGESVFGEKTYCSEVYANLQCVPALGGPLADVSACFYTVFKTDWGTVFFGADDVPTPEAAQAAIDRYRDLENRKDYDANHGNLYQAELWELVVEAKAELEAMGIHPAAVR